MDDYNASLHNTVGKKINRDIYSSNGVLLVPEETVITRDYAHILQKHGISLTTHDVTDFGPYSDHSAHPLNMTIDETVAQVSGLFAGIRKSRKIPLADMRKEVLPTIHEAADTTQLFGLFALLQAKDDYTYRHNIAVGVIATLIGKWMELGHQELLQLTTAALLHDVGKMLIPPEILNKPGKLTVEEFAWMKQHTVLGYELMKETVGLNHRQALVALQHHERMDGSGYPFGIDRQKIDLFSRIVSVADIFHAMTSKRVYHDPAPFYKVLFQMEKDAFGVLDPVITRLFIEKIMNQLIGYPVVLTDGSEGTIVLVQPHDPTHPLVQIGDEFVDLSKQLSLHIKQIG